MTVWIVYTEACKADEPSIDGVFTNKDAAQACHDAQVRELQQLNNVVWHEMPEGLSPDDQENYDLEQDWDYDVHLEEYEVRETFSGGLPAATVPVSVTP